MLRTSLRADDFLVAASPAMRAVVGAVDQFADGGAPVVICGEHGTGRELVARVLHQRGPRKTARFVAVRPTFEDAPTSPRQAAAGGDACERARRVLKSAELVCGPRGEVADSAGKIHRLEKGGSTLAVWSSAPLLAPSSPQGYGADGIVWDGKDGLYVNTFSSSTLLRFPINADGSAGTPSPIRVSPALSSPDGMRLLDASTLLVVEGAGRLTRVAVSGTTATATVLKDGLNSPTSVAHYGGYGWELVVSKDGEVLAEVVDYQLSQQFILKGLPPGTYSLTARVQDHDDNVGEDVISVTVEGAEGETDTPTTSDSSSSDTASASDTATASSGSSSSDTADTTAEAGDDGCGCREDPNGRSLAPLTLLMLLALPRRRVSA